MKKGIISIISANVICMMLGLITNFLLPKYLSIDSYGMLKTYSLYLSYAGFFSLGYSDGMYLKYGGKNIDDINNRELSNNFLNYIFLITAGSVLTFAAGYFLSDDVLTAFAFGVFTYNIMGYIKMLYQATGDFSHYTKALNIEKIVIFAANILLLFIFKFDNYLWYIWAQVLSGLMVTFFFSISVQKKIHFLNLGKFDFGECRRNIKDGYILMLGNLSSGIFTGLDRWFVKILLGNSFFAVYSFAVSFESMINIFLSPIIISMYNYFCKGPSDKEIIFAKKLTIVWGLLIAGGAFPAKFILETYLQKYIASNKIIVFLLAAQVFYLLVKGVYVNIYKANKEQDKYFRQLIIMIIVAFLLNGALYLIFRNMVCIAAATFITSVIWFLICESYGKKIHCSFQDMSVIIVSLIVYFICGLYVNPVIGGIAYYVVLVFMVYLLMKDCFTYFIDSIISMFHKA